MVYHKSVRIKILFDLACFQQEFQQSFHQRHKLNLFTKVLIIKKERYGYLVKRDLLGNVDY